MTLPQPHDINFFTTYKCNSRCRNCNIWQGSLVPPSNKEMDDKALAGLFSDPLFDKCGGIGLAGGEPTIAPFTWRLLEQLPGNKQITITTNALTSGKLLDFFRQCEDRQRYTVQLSLDGIGEENDWVRGVSGAYQKTLTLLMELESLGIRRLISFTINGLNYHQLFECYNLASRHGAEFGARIAYTGGAYSNRENSDAYLLNQEALERVEQQVADIIVREMGRAGHSPARLVFLKKMTDYYRREQRDLPCFAMQSGMVIDLYGNVFPNCPVMMQPVGNLHEAELSRIWESEQAEAVRRSIAQLKCGGCWNDCQVITNIAMARDFLEEEYAGMKIAALSSRAMALPVCLDFNDADSSSLLLSGWHGVEGDTGFCYRWTEQQFSIVLPRGATSVTLLAVFPDRLLDGGLQVEFFVGGEKRDVRDIDGGGWRQLVFSLASAPSVAELGRFRLSSYYCPRESGDGEDLRRLGAAIRKVIFT